MGDPITRNTRVTRRGVRPNLKLRIRVKAGIYEKMLLDLDALVARDDLISYLFISGTLPKGSLLQGLIEFGVAEDYAKRWRLDWKVPDGDFYAELTDEGQALFDRGHHGGIGGGDEFEEERQVRLEAEAKAKAEDQQYRQTHQGQKRLIPPLNMTLEELRGKLKYGAYVAARNRPIVNLASLQINEEFPTDAEVAWLNDYIGGCFISYGWYGMQLYEIQKGHRDRFWKFAIKYMRQGEKIRELAKEYAKLSREENNMMLAAFALTLASAPGLGPRPNIGETAAAEANRLLNRKYTPPPKFGNFASKIDPIEAATVGVQGLAFGIMADDLLRQHEEELQAAGEGITQNLQVRIINMPVPEVERNLRTGQLGEAVVKQTLRLRGYTVVELQNASGQGIDLVGIKNNRGQGLIVYVEVKTSLNDNAPGFSEAQKNPHAFVRNRLERIVAHEGLYRNVSQVTVDIARQLISEIDAGRPIGGIHVSVTGLAKGSIKVKFRHWKPSLPRAVARRNRGR